MTLNFLVQLSGVSRHTCMPVPKDDLGFHAMAPVIHGGISI